MRRVRGTEEERVKGVPRQCLKLCEERVKGVRGTEAV